MPVLIPPSPPTSGMSGIAVSSLPRSMAGCCPPEGWSGPPTGRSARSARGATRNGWTTSAIAPTSSRRCGHSPPTSVSGSDRSWPSCATRPSSRTTTISTSSWASSRRRRRPSATACGSSRSTCARSASRSPVRSTPTGTSGHPGRKRVDVFVGIFEDDSISWYPGTRGGLTRAIVFPPRSADLLGVPCWIPAQPEAYLERLYGEGWRVPDPYFRHVWDISAYADITGTPASTEPPS